MEVRCLTIDCKFNKGGKCENSCINVEDRVCRMYKPRDSSSPKVEDKERKELVERIDKLMDTVWKIVLDKPVYDLDTKELPNIINDVLNKAEMPVDVIELAVTVAEDLIEKKEELDATDVKALQDTLFHVKVKLGGHVRRRYRIRFYGSIMVDAHSEEEAIVKLMRMTMDDVKPEIEVTECE